MMDSLRERFERLEKARIRSSWKSLAWNASGAIGSKFLQRPPPEIGNDSRRFLNLGCGANKIAGWVNADFFRLHEWITRRSSAPDWMVDLRKPLPCSDNYWDGIFVEHTNEHLTYSQNLDMLLDLHRVVKPGGALRLVVPDLDRYLKFSKLRDEFPKFARYASLPEAVSNLTQNHGHQSVWNGELLCEVLRDAGFADVKQVDYQQGTHPELFLDSERRRWESLYVEAIKGP